MVPSSVCQILEMNFIFCLRFFFRILCDKNLLIRVCNFAFKAQVMRDFFSVTWDGCGSGTKRLGRGFHVQLLAVKFRFSYKVQIFIRRICLVRHGSNFLALHLLHSKRSSVADPGCLSRIPDPDFYPSRIPDLRSRNPKQQQKRGMKKILSFLFI
jgi:hypothetical protein